MATDMWGDLYAADGDPDYPGEIVAYLPGGTSKLLTIGAPATLAIAFDPSGNLYATNSVVIDEYGARSTRRIRTIRDGVTGADALAFDGQGRLYVGRTKGAVDVFAPDAYRPFLTIKDNLRVAYALTFDQSGRLYVANCPSCYNFRDSADSVNEYDSSTGKSIRVIRQAVNTPMAIAIGRHGLLFVANHPFLQQGTVTVYGTDGKLVRTVTDGVKGPDAIAIGPYGDVYVGNWCGCGEARDSISVFSSDGSRLLRQITSGVVAPSVLAIGNNPP